MHELPIMRNILSVVTRSSQLSEKKRLVNVTLKVGALRDLEEEWVQRYWDYITRGTYAEGSKVTIDVVPTTCECSKCGNIFGYDVFTRKKPCCPECGSEQVSLKSGNELLIDEVEVKLIT